MDCCLLLLVLFSVSALLRYVYLLIVCSCIDFLVNNLMVKVLQFFQSSEVLQKFAPCIFTLK